MGGHSHWSTIKRHKATQDAKRGRIFTKILREITVASRLGGGDPGANPRLRTVIAKAKEVNLPQDNIKKAIQKGTGELPGVSYEEIVYEGYGPGGVALLIEVMTDNRNRSISDVRGIMGKHGGSMGEAGCVAWMFQQKGYLEIDRSAADEERLLTLALEAGAEDFKAGDKGYEVITDAADFEQVKAAIEQERIPCTLAEVTMLPQTLITLEEKEARQLFRLLEMLDDCDDVQKVYANFDISDEMMERLAAE